MDLSEKTVLIVDDDPATLNVLKEMARRSLGLEVETAATGLDALDLVSRRHYDLVVTDLGMPEMDGITFVRTLGKHHPDLPVIVVTGHPYMWSDSAASTPPVFGVLTKPIELTVYVEAIRSALQEPGGAHSPPPAGTPQPSEESILMRWIEEELEDVLNRCERVSSGAERPVLEDVRARLLRAREHLHQLRTLRGRD